MGQAGRPPGRLPLLVLLILFHDAGSQDVCPSDTTEATGFALDGVPATCSQLTAYCMSSHEQMCTIANKCPASCGACSSQ